MKMLLLFLLICLVLFPLRIYSNYEIIEYNRLKEFVIDHFNNCLDKRIISNIGLDDDRIIFQQNDLNEDEFRSLKPVYYKCKKQLYGIIEKDLQYRAFFDSLDIFEYMPRLVEMIYFTHLKEIEFNFFNLVDSLTSMEWYLSTNEAYCVNLDSIDGIYIPKDIYECINDLKKVLPDEILNKIKAYQNADEASRSEHFGLGGMLRYRYQLWGLGSRLSSYFQALDISHGDHRSSIINQALWYDLNGLTIPFKEIIYKHRWYDKKTLNELYNKKPSR